MNPQGSNVINTSQYEAMGDIVESASSCKELQELSTKILESLNAENAAITDQLEKLAPIAALLEIPTDPEEVVTWVSDFITGFLQPLYLPATTYTTQLAARTAAIADLVDKINKKASSFADCSITIPTP